MGSALPDYERPPIDELVFGVQFRELEQLLIPHFGVLWDRFRVEYPQCQHATTLAHIVEREEGPQIAPIDPNEPPLPRVWFVQREGHGVIQVQRDRFLFNWRRQQADDAYPGYTAMLGRFEQHLDAFEAFLRENELGQIEVDQIELTYVDIFARGAGWRLPSDIGQLLPDLVWRPGGRYLEEPHSLVWQAAFTLPQAPGRLHVSARLAVRRADRVPVIRYEMTARGMARDQTREAIRAWFNQAHERIVRGFADLTGEEAQGALWRRRD